MVVILLAIVAGGLLLGMLGGQLVDPVMQRKGEGIGGKDPNAAARQRAAEEFRQTELIDASDEDPSDSVSGENDGTPPSSYRPDLDYDEENFGSEVGQPVDLLPPSLDESPPAAPAERRMAPARGQQSDTVPQGDDALPAIY